MKDFQFSPSLCHNFEERAEAKEILNVTCCNDLGQKVCFEGRILKIYDWYDTITEQSLIFQVVKKDKFVIPASVNYMGGVGTQSLYIMEIKDANGEVIFTHPNADEIIAETKSKRNYIASECAFKGRKMIDETSAPILLNLQNNVGKFVQIGDTNGLLVSMYCYSLWNNEPCVCIINHAHAQQLNIKVGHKIQVYNDKDELISLGVYNPNNLKHVPKPAPQPSNATFKAHL